MKRLVLAITLASLAALAPARAAAPPRARQCPRLFVMCVDVISPGQPATFTLSIEGDAPADWNPTYKWVVSAGTIASGQGTSSISVDTVGVGRGVALTATVEVGGLPASCTKSAACTPANLHAIPHDKVDEYGDISFEDEKARLDNMAIELQNGPEAVGYIVGYGGRRSRRGEAARRLARAKRYLTTARAIPPEQVVLIDGGHREQLTVELRIRQRGDRPPPPWPTVKPGEVIFIEPAKRRRARRRR